MGGRWLVRRRGRRDSTRVDTLDRLPCNGTDYSYTFTVTNNSDLSAVAPDNRGTLEYGARISWGSNRPTAFSSTALLSSAVRSRPLFDRPTTPARELRAWLPKGNRTLQITAS